MKLYNFKKMHGLGNDFLIFPWSEELPQKNIIKALFISTFASIGTIFFAIQYLQVA